MTKPVEHYNGYCRIHIDGRVEVKNNERWIPAPLQVMDNRKGYYIYIPKHLRDDTTPQKKSVHMLYAESFIPNPNNYKHVSAKDDDVNNLTRDNLYWHEDAHTSIWYRENAKPCAQCGKLFTTTSGYDQCMDCRKANAIKANQQSRIEERRAPFMGLDITQFPKRTQEYIQHIIDGKSFEEAASIEGVSKQAVHASIKRAMKKYRNAEYYAIDRKDENS